MLQPRPVPLRARLNRYRFRGVVYLFAGPTDLTPHPPLLKGEGELDGRYAGPYYNDHLCVDSASFVGKGVGGRGRQTHFDSPSPFRLILPQNICARRICGMLSP